MKHKFRKYISKRGSALFMVLSVMTALIVTCMAMYFSVVSSRKTQYAIFNQQQAYQSAVSLNESLLGAIYSKLDGSTNGSGFSALSEAMFKLNQGETLTTSGNEFSSFNAGLKVDEDQVGAYTADITMLGEVTDGKLFDIAVTTMVNGTESISHQYVVLGGETPGNDPPSRQLPLFIASGLVPTSPALNAGYMFSDVFYDSEFTHFMPYGPNGNNGEGGAAELKTMGDVYAGGTLTVNYRLTEADGKNHNNRGSGKPHTWAIRKDLIMTNGECPVSFTPESKIGDEYADKTNRVYVGGDCIFKSNARGFENCEIYVLGDLIIEPGAKIGNNVKIFVAGKKEGTVSGTNVTVSQGLSNRNEIAGHIEYCTQDVPFYDWNSRYETIPGIEKEEIAHFVQTPGTPAAQFVWSESNQGCTIKGVDGFGGITGGNFDYNNGTDVGYKLVIDTGNDPGNVYTIRLKPYLKSKGSTKNDTFSWCPKYGDYATWVIVKGKGSVVFEVEDGVTYENRSYKTNVMHVDWATSRFGSQGDRDQVKNLITDGWIHYECGDNCTECKNELKKIAGEKCKKCGGDMYQLRCDNHNLNRAVCLNENCDGKSFKYKEEGGKLYSYGTCQYRVNKKGSKAPNMNIFLVMCGQNSKIQFTPGSNDVLVNGINESFSSFWGYIYAPYAPLNFSAQRASGDKAQFVGGIAVGSFNLFGKNSYMPAYPDRLPDEIMSDKCKEHELPTIDSKTWKEPLNNGATA